MILSTRAPAYYPLHPLRTGGPASLCSRYGQNERTLFSFLAGARAACCLLGFLIRNWSPKMPLPSLLVSTRLTTSPSEHLSWNICDGEQVARIEGRIRDIRWHQWNLTCTLKTIGVLNLRVSGGSLAPQSPY